MSNPNSLFYMCSLVEFIGRERKLRRSEVVVALGRETLRRIYRYADIFHCEPIEKVAADFIGLCEIPFGSFDNVASCRYAVPSYWDIGAVYARLIEDITDAKCDPIDQLIAVYSSFIDVAISRFNSDFFYQPREYIAGCYKAGEILAA